MLCKVTSKVFINHWKDIRNLNKDPSNKKIYYSHDKPRQIGFYLKIEISPVISTNENRFWVVLTQSSNRLITMHNQMFFFFSCSFNFLSRTEKNDFFSFIDSKSNQFECWSEFLCQHSCMKALPSDAWKIEKFDSKFKLHFSKLKTSMYELMVSIWI